MNPRQLLEIYGLRPKKRLGQNFLTDKRALDKIVEAAELSPQDTVIEIGPGLGTLTVALAKKAKKVIAIEKDPNMVEILKETIGGQPNVQIIKGDILSLAKDSLAKLRNYKAVANLPYYITSPVIRKFLEVPNKPKLMVLMVQKEVAQRICAKPPDMNLLAVSVQFYGKPKIVSYVKRTSFWPQPDVDSAILRIAPLINADTKPRNADIFFTVARAGFKQPRKQLVNNLSQGLHMPKEKIARWLARNNLEPTQRAETLRIKDWVQLAKSYKKL